MNPIAHAELSWLLLAQPLQERRDRTLVFWAGVLPDADGVTLVAYPFDQGEAYGHYHHLLTHSLPAALVVAAGAAVLATRGAKTKVSLLAFLAFHLHLACDLLGSGKAWAISYLFPFADYWVKPLRFGWELNGWQNQIIGVIATFAVLAMGVFKGRTVVEVFSAKWDRVVCGVLQRWARRPSPASP